ncbi:beta-ketoacyl synthase N-terminal-like domain-containing protein [Nocardia sp. NPDC051750]|uniref:beta-ketoacyl synthase N-terminal-like domain-containing protein n=1 Tax=Nocardia sp. NPDC051750 TaxID=3364325 RepID=UPI0037A8F627
MVGTGLTTDLMSITGIGAVTGYGWGRETLWEGLLSGVPAARFEPGYGLDPTTGGWVALVPDDGAATGADGTRYGRAVLAAVAEAVADAQDRGWSPGPRVGLVNAAVLGDVRHWLAFSGPGGTDFRGRDFLRLLPSTPVSVVNQAFGFTGPVIGVSAACSSANVAMVQAQLWFAAGLVDDVVCVASDLSATPELVRQFCALGAAVVDTESLDGCRPFQEGSRGFSVGEAAVAFVLTRDPVPAYATVLGGAMNNEAHHVVSLEPSHDRVVECVRLALADAGVDAADIRYLNAHGTGTAQCDRAERDLLTRVFADRPAVYSIKPLAGHCQAASGAVELAAAALGYERGVIPAPPAVAPAHHRMLDGATAAEPGLTAKLSLGMGGNNSMVVLAPGSHAAA